jgi:hypothetical protein
MGITSLYGGQHTGNIVHRRHSDARKAWFL